MLGEVALTPEVLQHPDNSQRGIGLSFLKMLQPRFMDDTVVRDLCTGAWSQYLGNALETLSPHGKELFFALKKNGRLIRDNYCAPIAPSTDRDWCHAALSSHMAHPLHCVLTTSSTKGHFKKETLVTSEKHLTSQQWWQDKRQSVRLARRAGFYIAHLQKLLGCSNSVMFIDPHLNPQRPGYAEFFQLLKRCHRDNAPLVRVEIHRVCYEGSGPSRSLVDTKEWERRFVDVLKPQLSNVNLIVDVFIWDDFHDRYLISDLMGISMLNGFDVSKDTSNQTTWARLSRDDRDDIQREFSAEDGRHALRHRFRLV